MERVVVTGVGLVTPLGLGAEATWDNAIQGRSGVGPITLFEATEEFPTRIAAEVKDFEPADFLEKKKLKARVGQESWPSGSEDMVGQYFQVLSGGK